MCLIVLGHFRLVELLRDGLVCQLGRGRCGVRYLRLLWLLLLGLNFSLLSWPWLLLEGLNSLG